MSAARHGRSIEPAPRAAKEGPAVHTQLPQWAIWSEMAARVGWVAVAAVLWAVMSRRGHDGGLWAVIGLVLGPFAVPAAVISVRRAARRPPIIVAEGPPWGAAATRPALVLVDPDDDHVGWAAQAAAADAVGDRVELAVVVGRDRVDLGAREGALRRARRALTAVAAAMPGPPPRQVILEGRPEAAVAHHCQLHGIATVIAPPTPTGDRVRRALGDRLAVHTAGPAGLVPSDGLRAPINLASGTSEPPADAPHPRPVATPDGGPGPSVDDRSNNREATTRRPS
jgi:hypothetical protein